MEREEYRINKPLSLENLITAIEDLETEGIISFENFKGLTFLESKKKYFSMSNPTMIERAIIKIADYRSGKNGPSEDIVIKKTIKDGKLVKTSTRITYF